MQYETNWANSFRDNSQETKHGRMAGQPDSTDKTW